jgi:hypothetical protein
MATPPATAASITPLSTIVNGLMLRSRVDPYLMMISLSSSFLDWIELTAFWMGVTSMIRDSTISARRLMLGNASAVMK